MKKLILVLILMLSCIFGLTACNDDKTENVEKELSPELKAGQSFIKQLYVNASSETPADYMVVSSAAKCTVEWTVEVTSGNAEDVKVVVDKDGVVTIDVNEKAATDVLYILTATISYNGETTTLTYERKVPKFQELTYAEYATKEKGDAVVVKGIVVGILSKAAGDTVDGLFLHTPEGGFYIYGVANTDVTPMTEYKLGQEVRASGTMDIYNGTLEVKDAVCEILNATPVAYEAVDYTEAFKNAADATLEAIGAPQAMLVTLKDVVISDIAESNGYYNFTLGGKTSYMRISGSTCPLNAADTDTFKAQWAAHRGYTADITGVVSIYSGNFYLQPCDANAVVYKSLPQLSEAEKVAYEKDNLALDTTKFADGVEVQLPVTGGAYSDVAISWASESAEVTVNADGLATVATGGKTVNVKLVATLTLGATTLTKEFTFEISAEPDAVNTTIGALVANKPTTEKDLVYIVTGTWSAKDGMEPSANTYGNGFLTDEAGNKITIYGLSSSKSCLTYSEGAYTYKNAKDFPTLNIAEGAIVTVGMVYTIQYDNYSAYLIEVSNEPAAVKTTIAKLVTTKPTTEKDLVYVVTGTWTAKDGMAPADNKYGNGFLEDADGNKITIYGLSSSRSCLSYADGAYTYKNAKDFPTLEITDGAVLTVGMIYTIQFDNYSAYLISAESGSTPTPDPVTEPDPVETTIAELTTNVPTADNAQIYIVTGTWSAKDGMEPSANQYGNGFLTDAEGNQITIYGLSSSKSCLAFNNGVYKYTNAKDFSTLNITDGKNIKVGMVYSSQYKNYSAYLIEVVEEVTPEPEGDPVKNTTIAELVATKPTTEMDVVYIVTGIWTPKNGMANSANQYGNGFLEDADGNKITIYGLSSTKDKCLVYANNKYTYTNAKDFPSLDLAPYSIVKVGMVYTKQYDNYSAYLIEVSGSYFESLSDDEKVAFDKAQINVVEETTANITLPTAGVAGSTIAWASDNEAVISAAGVVVRPAAGSEDAVVTLTATITNGAASQTATFKVTVKAEIDSTESVLLATFTFGANGSASHNDGSEVSAGKAFDADGYSLTLSSASKVYAGARDAKGNSALKLGTSKVVGKFTFTVADDVNSVVIYVAQYKANATKVKINGTTHTISTASNNGAYTAITVDTSTTKTVSFETVSGGARCMIDTIEFHS